MDQHVAELLFTLTELSVKLNKVLRFRLFEHPEPNEMNREKFARKLASNVAEY